MELALFGKGGRYWLQELPDRGNRIREGIRRIGKPGLPDESPPLNNFPSVLYERWIEYRGSGGNRHISDRLIQDLSLGL